LSSSRFDAFKQKSKTIKATKDIVVRTASICLTTIASLLLLASIASAQDKKNPEDEYYKLTSFPMTEQVNLEAGGLELMPDGKLAISTRRGDIYLLDKPLTDDPTSAEFTLFAGGLHEVLGISWNDGWLTATQRGEVTRMKDEDNDGRADLFETLSDGWEISGDYHEYAFGSRPDKDGNIWVVLCLTGSFDSNSKYRGWCLRITPEGKVIPTCSGIRSPGGIAMNAEGDMFYTDNQGPWNGTSSLKWLRPGSFQGHPGGNKWYEATGGVIGPRPADPTSKSRMMVEAKKIPELEPPAVYFPYGKMGQSASGIVCDTTGGKFGPFKNQLFVGDQTHSTVMRVFLEKVKGHYQGVCFPWRQGIGSGTLSLLIEPTGHMFVGGTNRGWGSRGSQPYSLDRLDWTGKTPFEVLEMHAKSDGFELTFTEKVDPKTAGDPKSYKVASSTVIYQADYGSPEVDGKQYAITKVDVAADGMSARLFLDKPTTEGHYHEVKMSGVKSASGLPLLHDVGYYTMNYIPD
jgi:glucose/arabinose dehydrogenase